jgi:rhodanese-related sulfurtransferase
MPARSGKIQARGRFLLLCAAMTDELELSPQQVRDLQNAQLVDVRTAAEWDESRIEGARHVPLEQLGGVARELDRERPLVFYCRVGERSAMAAEAFRSSGWDAHSLAGGLIAWADEGLPLEPEGAPVAQHSSIPSP